MAQHNSQGLLVSWRPFIPSNVTGTVKISRSYDSESLDYEYLTTVKCSQGWFFDDTVSLRDRWRKPFYKLVINDDSGRTREYGPIHLVNLLDPIDRAIIKENQIYLRLAGVEVLVYQLRGEEGDPCPSCWDPELGKSSLSNCPICLGTGKVYGYYPPILTLAALGKEVQQNTLTDRKTQEASVEAFFSSYPILNLGDIVCFVGMGDRYRVADITQIVKHRALLAQSTSMVALKPTDPSDKIPLPEISTLQPLLVRKRGYYQGPAFVNPNSNQLERINPKEK